AVRSLYRSFLREIRILPQDYLRRFFRLKLADDFRTFLSSESGKAKASDPSKMKRMNKELLRLKLANVGHKKAFNHILDLAYGRKGRLKWSIMKPLLHDPTVPPPPRIISAVERSRPPIYSPELTALLTSSYSRTSRNAVSRQHLQNPPMLPPRADRSSEEARLFGPLSKRREVNIRWHYFTTQWKRLFPPIELSKTQQGAGVGNSDSVAAGAAASVRTVGLQSACTFQELEEFSGMHHEAPPTPRRQVLNRDQDVRTNHSEENRRKAPNRYLRRRYMELLGRIPILTYTP
ncbi:hypothetical protein BV25DRAFT_1790937, partial [Artomyces pyxidatus]